MKSLLKHVIISMIEGDMTSAESLFKQYAIAKASVIHEDADSVDAVDDPAGQEADISEFRASLIDEENIKVVTAALKKSGIPFDIEIGNKVAHFQFQNAVDYKRGLNKIESSIDKSKEQ